MYFLSFDHVLNIIVVVVVVVVVVFIYTGFTYFSKWLVFNMALTLY